MMKDMARQKIAVLGGGVGAMSAVWALTSLPGAAEHYDIHVYQMGWRLGGKGASGRNAAAGQRIEEHGLHVFSGFYDNTFAMMREVLDAVKHEEGTFHSLDEAFAKANDIVLGEAAPSGWRHWPMAPEMKDDAPGIGGQDLSPWGYFTAAVAAMRDALDRIDPDHAAHRGPRDGLPSDATGRHLLARLGGLIGALGSAPLHLLQALAGGLPGGYAGGRHLDDAALRWLVQQVQGDLRARRVAAHERETLTDDVRRMHQMLDLGAAALRGMVADGVITHGFDSIDAVEIRDWLARHGAHPAALDSPAMKAVYDYVFGYRHGLAGAGKGAIAAGTFLRGSLRLMLTYKGAIFYRMQAGMGDTIFTPLYKALCARGVTFHFFHKIKALHLDPSGRAIAAIALERQVDTPDDYRPFVRVGRLDCWPNTPDWSQIKGGEQLAAAGVNLESSWSAHEPAARLMLKRGEDFDQVICGIPVGALPQVAVELIPANPAWRHMVERVETVATQAVQLWLRQDAEKLGWALGPAILTAYADDLNTWADMTHLAGAEDWPEGQRPASIAYFCGPLADPPQIPPFSDTGYPERMRAQVQAQAAKWMADHLRYIYPGLIGADGAIDPAGLVAPDGAADAFGAQYFRANVEPSERYVLSVPGSTTARLRADRSGFDNLWLAGDWTYTGINAGCAEAAVMSGMRAAAGLAGIPARIVGEEAEPHPGGSAPNPSQSTAPVLRSLRPQQAGWPWSAVFGMAQTTGPCVTLAMPRDAVAAMLPRGLALAPQAVTGPQQHPVILLFGQQRDVRVNLLPLGIPSYLEFICAVPWVMHTDRALADLAPMIWPQRLYLDSAPPIALGVYGFGLPKKMAAITFDDDSYVVRDSVTGAEIIAAGYSRRGPDGRSHDYPHFAAVRPGYEMAMVTPHRLLGWQYTVYDFSLDSAHMAPLAMEVRIGANDFGLPAGLHHVPPLSLSALGGFFLTAGGTINNPFQSFDIKARLRQGGPR